ncbi:MAG: putative lipopolysaccharide heptosyltransferase III [Magnetococcales bacterium]|nr:putative lipopolysaccharide heptosyltransferase III [Magnetococcales bacterium]
MSFRHLLVINLREIGDVLVSTPVFSALREAFPAARLTALVPAKTVEMLAGNPDVDHVLPLKRGWEHGGGRVSGWMKDARFLWSLRHLGVDGVIDLTANDRSALLAYASGAPVRIARRRMKGFTGRRRLYTREVAVDSQRPMAAQLVQILEGLDLHPEAERFPLRLTVPPEDQERVDRLLEGGGPFIHFHPLSRLPVKCWSDAGMAALMDESLRRGFTPVVTAAPDPWEMDKVRAILALTQGERCLNLSGQLTLKQLAGVTRRARLFVGVDSAPMHMAAAMATPVLALFGPSDERLWGPWRVPHRVVSRNLPCRLPCHNKKGCQTRECIRDLPIPDALVALSALLDDLPHSR